MSGSGNGGGGGGGGGGEVLDCPNLFVKATVLSSPVPSVLEKLKIGDELSLRPQSPRGPLVAFTPADEAAGSITSASLAKLLACIEQGYEYIAVVKRVEKGACEVEIRPIPMEE